MNNVLASPPLTTGSSRAGLWTGRVLTGLIAAFLLVDAGAKLVPLAPVVGLLLWFAYGLRSAPLRAFILSAR